MKQNSKARQLAVNGILLIISLCFIFPFLLIVSASLAGKNSLDLYGYTFWPKEFNLDAYTYIFKNPTQLINAYKTTIITSLATVFLGTFIMCLTAYPLSRRNYPLRKPATFIIFFTMLFSGGLVPSYIVNTQYLHLGNTYWIYILPALCNAWNIIVIRTFFQGISESIIEAAKIDGASEWRVFFEFILPLSKPVIATIALFVLLAKWNDWNTSLIYIRDNNLYSTQYLLQKILREAEFVKSMSENGMGNMGTIQVSDIVNTPTESIRYAMVVVAAGPMLFVFPFFQKYFAKGLTIGSVKG